MRAVDVTNTLELVLAASGCDSGKLVHKPRLLSDNGSSFISSDLRAAFPTELKEAAAQLVFQPRNIAVCPSGAD
jgi:transposase InsO family protein